MRNYFKTPRVIAVFITLSLLLFGATLGVSNGNWQAQDFVTDNKADLANVSVQFEGPGGTGMCAANADTTPLTAGQQQSLNDCSVQNSGDVPLTLYLSVSNATESACSDMTLIASAGGTAFTDSGDLLSAWGNSPHGIFPGGGTLAPGARVSVGWGVSLPSTASQSNSGECIYDVTVTGVS